MSLIITARNLTGLGPHADYEVRITVNERKILWTGTIRDHQRSNGAAALIRMISKAVASDPQRTGPIKPTP